MREGLSTITSWVLECTQRLFVDMAYLIALLLLARLLFGYRTSSLGITGIALSYLAVSIRLEDDSTL